MQDVEYSYPLWGFSVNGSCWFVKGRGGERQNNKREKELHLWISSGPMLPSEDRLTDTLFSVPDEAETSLLDSGRSIDRSTCLVTRSSTVCCLPKEASIPLAFTPSGLCVIHLPHEGTRKTLVLNPKDLPCFITKNLNLPAQRDKITEDLHGFFTALYCDHTPARLSDNISIVGTERTIRGRCVRPRRTSLDFETPKNQLALDLSSGGDRNGNVLKINTCDQNQVKSCQSDKHPGEESWTNRNVRMRKSVSFNEDVVVFLFDERSPTLKLPVECCTLPARNQYTKLPRLPVEDNAAGLEWEDDFATLQRNYHFRCVERPPPCAVPLSDPREHCQAQSCLFLTYVTESDLDP